MFTYYRLVLFLILSILWLIAAAGPNGPLSLGEAEQLALDTDPVTRGLNAGAEGFEDLAVAQGQLPDPKIKLGMMNVPVNSFAVDAEPMTQIQVGVQQMFPPGETLRYRREYTEAMADVEKAKILERKLKLLREVRQRYLDLYYRSNADRILQQNRTLFSDLVAITQRQYAAGRDNQHDVLRAQLELSLLDDRIMDMEQQEEVARAGLARYVVYEQASRPLPEAFPELKGIPPRDQVRQNLPDHPLVMIEDAAIDAGKKKVAEAEQQYKPGWSVDVTYGNRNGMNADGSGRPDMLSAMVMIDVPLFTNKRQDKKLSAARKQNLAQRFSRDDRLLELSSMLETEYSNWTRLRERLDLYRQRASLDAKANAESTLNAYQSDTADFTTLMRAQLTELNTQLDMLRIHVELAKAQARLLYLTGETE